MSKVLDANELLTLENLNIKVRQAESGRDINEERKNFNELEQKSLATHLELLQYRLEKLNRNISWSQQQIQQAKKTLNDFSKQLEQKYDLEPGRWGLNTETGELDDGKEVSLR